MRRLLEDIHQYLANRYSSQSSYIKLNNEYSYTVYFDPMSVKNYLKQEWSFSVSNNWKGGDWDMFNNNTKDSDNNWIDQDNNIIIQSDGKVVNTKNLFKGSLEDNTDIDCTFWEKGNFARSKISTLRTYLFLIQMECLYWHSHS